MNYKIRDAVDSATVVHFSGLLLSKWAALYLPPSTSELVDVTEAASLAAITFAATIIVCVLATNFQQLANHNESIGTRAATILITAFLAGAGTFTGITGMHDITEGVVFSVACIHITDIISSGLMAGIRICAIPFATFAGILGSVAGSVVTMYTFAQRNSTNGEEESTGPSYAIDT